MGLKGTLEPIFHQLKEGKIGRESDITREKDSENVCVKEIERWRAERGERGRHSEREGEKQS